MFGRLDTENVKGSVTELFDVFADPKKKLKKKKTTEEGERTAEEEEELEKQKVRGSVQLSSSQL